MIAFLCYTEALRFCSWRKKTATIHDGELLSLAVKPYRPPQPTDYHEPEAAHRIYTDIQAELYSSKPRIEGTGIFLYFEKQHRNWKAKASCFSLRTKRYWKIFSCWVNSLKWKKFSTVQNKNRSRFYQQDTLIWLHSCCWWPPDRKRSLFNLWYMTIYTSSSE